MQTAPLPLIRLGMEGRRKTCLDRARSLQAPILVSANSFWDNRRRCFARCRCYHSLDLALDSGGFVAMRLYHGYRFSPDQYAALAADLAPTWWAQMDFCCEPELSASRRDTFARIDRTVSHLLELRRLAAARGIPAPLPVLQGWLPADYTSGPIWDQSAAAWPDLVGVGSVCRRHLAGPAGLLAVVAALDAKLPPQVRLHLFGVKSAGLLALADRFPARLASVDSMAWNVAARRDAARRGARSAGRDADHLAAWYSSQLRGLSALPPRLNL